MYWFWSIFFAVQPYFLIFGLLGLFGEEAKEAADDLATGVATVLLIAIILAVISGVTYLILKWLRII